MKRRHWYTAFVGLCWMVIASAVIIACLFAPKPAPQATSVSCPLAEQVARLEMALDELEGEQLRAEGDCTERMMQMSHSAGVGLIDVACLYRGHVLQTHDGHPAHEVRDKPVPGAWDPLSPLIEPPTRAECMQRFR